MSSCRSSLLSFRRFLRGIPKAQKALPEAAVADEVPLTPKAEVPVLEKEANKDFKLKLDPALEQRLATAVLKAKHHPGLRNQKLVVLPDEIQTAVFSLIGKYKLEDVKRASNDFVQRLRSRLPPADTIELRAKAAGIEEKLRTKFDIGSDTPSREEQEIFEESIKRKLLTQLRQTVYHWKPIEFDAYNCLLYLYSRFPAEYAVLTKIFGEIRAKDENFKPEYLLDIGSGLCSALWATKPIWNDGVRVALCIDTSPDMLKIAKLLMQGGKASGKSAFNGVFFKPVVPHGDENKYDLVTSAYSLLDRESEEDRLKLYDAMLSKTRKYIVIVEQATTGGFKLILEARSFFLAKGGVRILAPCPHALTCPRVTSQELSQICSFSTNYSHLRLVTQKENIVSEHYSYLILEKISSETVENVQNNWPRVLHSAPRARHVHLHTCCPDGFIRQMAVTKNKNGQHTYKCASYCRAGDLLPCTLEPMVTPEEAKGKPE